MHQDRRLPIPTLYEIEQLSDVLARGKYHARLSFGDIVHVKLQMPVTANSRRRVGQEFCVDDADEMASARTYNRLGHMPQSADVDAHWLLARHSQATGSRAWPR